jgi:hypothetical protein
VQGLKSVRVRASDFSGHLDVLRDPANSPLRVMPIETQRRNDCQSFSAEAGAVRRAWYVSGFTALPDLSEAYCYNASEYAMAPSNVGGDRGTSIHSGVRVQVEGLPRLGVGPGICTEAAWPYSRYCRRASEFERYAKGLQTEDCNVTEVGDMPDWDDMLASLAAGATGHIGTKWGVDWQTVSGAPKRVMDRMPTGGGGHATEILWAVEVRGQWYLAVWNSHGDGYYLMSRRAYDQLQKAKWEPFGAFLLTPDKMQERYDRITSGGGYFA